MAEDIQGFILSIVGIAVVLAIGLIVMGQLRTSIGTSCVGAVYTPNSSYVADLNGTNLCQQYYCNNNTEGAKGTGVYTVNATRTGCYNVSSSVDNINGTLTIVQLPSSQGLDYNASRSVAVNLSSIPNWIGILITISLAFIVLGYFYNRS